MERWREDFITQGIEACAAIPAIWPNNEAGRQTLLAKVGELTLHKFT